MAEGTIKRLTDKGFGFIDTGDGKDIFFHMSSLEDVTYEELREEELREEPVRLEDVLELGEVLELLPEALGRDPPVPLIRSCMVA